MVCTRHTLVAVCALLLASCSGGAENDVPSDARNATPGLPLQSAQSAPKPSIAVFEPSDRTAGGYTMCRTPGDAKPHLVCGSGCRGTDRFMGYHRETPSECQR